ncbi:unnamed protein product, partial [Schistosoma turkestanicum]
MIARLQKGYLKQSTPGRSGLPNQLSPFFIPTKLHLSNTKKPIWDWKEFTDHIELIINYKNHLVFNNFCNELDQLRILCTWNKSEKTTDQSNSSGVLMLRTVLNGEYHCFELSLCAQLRPDLCTLRLNHSTVDNFDSLSCSSAYSSSFSASSSLRSSSSCCSLSNSSSVTGEKNDRDRLTYLSIHLIKMSTIKSSSSISCLLTPVSSSSIISSSGSSSTLLPPNIDSLKLAEKSTKSTFRTIGIVLRDVCIGLDVENSTVS